MRSFWQFFWRFFGQCLSLLCCICGSIHVPAYAQAQIQEQTQAQTQTQTQIQAPAWSFAAIPRLNLNSDDGLGLGLRGAAYWRTANSSSLSSVNPYQTAISAQIFATTAGIQQHFLRIDSIDVFDLPLRLEGEIGYQQTQSQNFCGLGNFVTCSPALSDLSNISSPSHDLENPQFFKLRWIQPYGSMQGRWRFNQKPHRFEAFAGWRIAYTQHGDWNNPTPFADSLYAQQHPAGESGVSSVLMMGLSLDNRDHESMPRKGYWLDTSWRFAHPWIGSTWNYGVYHLTGRLYVPLDRIDSEQQEIHWSLATRTSFEQVFGDAPVQDLLSMYSLSQWLFYGGADAGRGIRVQRYLGTTRLLQQVELRWHSAEVPFLGQRWRLILGGFIDAGAAMTSNEITQPWRLHIGTGLLGRLVWNDNFSMRLDFGISPDEYNRISVYSGAGQPY